MTLHADWKHIVARAWSVRAALFWGAFNGALLGLVAFTDILNPYLFLALNVVGYSTIVVARVLKQPGADL